MNGYQERPWLKAYDKNVPHSLDYQDGSIPNILEKTASKAPDRPALVYRYEIPTMGKYGTTLRYKHINDLAQSFAAGLVHLGLKKGDVVALIIPNSPVFVVSYFGVLLAGGIVAPMNASILDETLKNQIAETRADFIITMASHYPLLCEHQNTLSIKQIIVAQYQDLLPPFAHHLLAMFRKDSIKIADENTHHLFHNVIREFWQQYSNVDVQGNDIAVRILEPPDSDNPCIIDLSHQAIIANLMQLQAFWSPIQQTGLQQDSILNVVPPYHSFGLVAALNYGILIGGVNILVSDPFNTRETISLINLYKPTIVQGVSAFFDKLVQQRFVWNKRKSLKSIRFGIIANGTLTNETKTRLELLCAAQICEGFGMSELVSVTHLNPIYGENRRDSIGVPIPDVQVRVIRSIDDPLDVPVGEFGEMVISAPNMLHDYFRQSGHAKVIRVLDGQPWLFTGEIVRMDEDGYFYRKLQHT